MENCFSSRQKVLALAHKSNSFSNLHTATQCQIKIVLKFNQSIYKGAPFTAGWEKEEDDKVQTSLYTLQLKTEEEFSWKINWKILISRRFWWIIEQVLWMDTLILEGIRLG